MRKTKLIAYVWQSGEDEKWRWTLRAGGDTIAVCGQGYTSKQWATTMAGRLTYRGKAPEIVSVEGMVIAKDLRGEWSMLMPPKIKA